MIDLVVIGIALVCLLIMKLLLRKITYVVRVAHAGQLDSNESNIREVVAYKNRPIYKTAYDEIDVSKFVPLSNAPINFLVWFIGSPKYIPRGGIVWP